MKTLFFRLVKLIGKTVVGFLGFLLLYSIYALIGIVFPQNTEYEKHSNGISIYVITNGFHTDLVLPLQESNSGSWFEFFDQRYFDQFRDYQYVAIGWGDAGFYQESYNNAFPTSSTILKAIFIPTPTLMHIDFYRKDLEEGENCVKLWLSNTQYQSLQSYIQKSFRTDNKGKTVLINAKGYTDEDFFFEAQNSYHLFRTCNDWTNECLAKIGFKMPRCAPFSESVFFYLR